ncbi:hypothetical protein BS17DRAFT_573680 [Gyrodon lividus]|nr:hypothetical protein BS17DRAFT_573680 [Gyrodon lividus]
MNADSVARLEHSFFYNTNPHYWQQRVNRWFGARYNLLAAATVQATVSVTGLVAVTTPSISAALAGFLCLLLLGCHSMCIHHVIYSVSLTLSSPGLDNVAVLLGMFHIFISDIFAITHLSRKPAEKSVGPK